MCLVIGHELTGSEYPFRIIRIEYEVKRGGRELYVHYYWRTHEENITEVSTHNHVFICVLGSTTNRRNKRLNLSGS